MLGLPIATEISKSLPKKAIYAKFGLKPAQRDHFDEDVAKLAIVNIISPTTIPALPRGEQIECIYIIDILLKKQDYDPKNIHLLSKLIPQKLVFVLRFENNVQLAINHTKLICSSWMGASDAILALQGLNLDRVWENIVISIGDIQIEEGSTLEEQIQVDDAKAKILKQIEQLEAKARNEKQPRKKLQYFEELKCLKSKIS
ncbi:MAG: DUF4391 domain-containing protein [Bacteroidales bacterium]|nr:DUF4391 domain-containing protein [Bacteroidales bacterium]